MIMGNEKSQPANIPAGQTTLALVPTTLADANAFIAQHHRHHQPVVGHKFSIALSDGEAIRGVVIVGRPVSRHLDNGTTLGVTRCCTDGVPNGCSKLYRAAERAAANMGFKRLITYTLGSEGGASLRGAGFKLLGERGGGSWSRKERPRSDDHPLARKLLWELTRSGGLSMNQPKSNVGSGFSETLSEGA